MYVGTVVLVTATTVDLSTICAGIKVLTGTGSIERLAARNATESGCTLNTGPTGVVKFKNCIGAHRWDCMNAQICPDN